MEKMSRKKARKPAELKTGDYTKEQKEELEKEKNFAQQFKKEDIFIVPDYLDERATKYYEMLIGQLKEISTIADIDKPSLINLAKHLGILEEAHRHHKIHGNLMETNYGLKPNPSLKIIKDYTVSYLILAKSMSLTPEMRQYMQKLTEENTSAYATEDNVDFLKNLLQGEPKQ